MDYPDCKVPEARSPKSEESIDEVTHIAEAACLRPVSENSQRLAGQGERDEGRNHAPIVTPHPRAEGVEDSSNPNFGISISSKGHGERFRISFGFVVHAARANGVHVSPVRLDLWVNSRVAINLARAGEHHSGAIALRALENMACTIASDVQRLKWQLHIVDGACRRGEMEDALKRLCTGNALTQVGLHKPESRATIQVGDVGRSSSHHVVECDDLVTKTEQALTQVGPKKSRAARHQCLHALPLTTRSVPLLWLGHQPLVR